MVEQGEECDCGYSDQCKDECCFDANQPEGKKCKLKPGKDCRYLVNFNMLIFLQSHLKAVMTNLKLKLKDAYGFETYFLLHYLFFWNGI
jgi:hypothetical protein